VIPAGLSSTKSSGSQVFEGSSTFLVTELDLDGMCQETSLSNLEVITVSPLPRDPLVLLSSQLLARFSDQMRESSTMCS
jgi:hypothetical protein